MFIQFGNCEKCGNKTYVALIGLKAEVLYTCTCVGRNEAQRVMVGVLQQQNADNCLEWYRRIERFMREH